MAKHGVMSGHFPDAGATMSLVHWIMPLKKCVWKFVKGEISSKYYDNFDTFKQTIDFIISSTDGENKPKINRLIGKGVQLFYNLVPVGENTFAFLNDDKNAA